MPEPYLAPHALPVLRRQRLVRIDEATTFAGHASLRIASVPADASPALPSPFLEGQVWLAVEASRLLRETQPLLEAEHMPTAAQEVLRLVRWLLQVLLGELAAGADARVAAIDGVFATLLNSPGHSGLIAQGLQALSTSATPAAPVQRSADDSAALEALCRLHRDLVGLSLGWEELLDLALPTAGSGSGAPDTPARVLALQVPPLLTPLPLAVVVTQPGSGGGGGYQYPGVVEGVVERVPLGLRLVTRLERGFTRVFTSWS